MYLYIYIRDAYVSINAEVELERVTGTTTDVTLVIFGILLSALFFRQKGGNLFAVPLA
jgi:hypothetical protein